MNYSKKFVGGRLCLDFANTADWHTSENPQETLIAYVDLVAWSQKAGLLKIDEAKEILHKASKNPLQAKKALRRAVELREHIFRIFLSVADDLSPGKDDIDFFNKKLSLTMGYSQIIPSKDGFFWEIKGNRDILDWFLHPVVRSAVELLTSKDLKRVKRCADPECGWLFLDKSKNRSRCWCDMEDCGNRAKARRFYKRKRKT